LRMVELRIFMGEEAIWFEQALAMLSGDSRIRWK
jgi:hypothetical protein